MTQTDWISALAILVAGLILGLTFVYFFNRRRSVAHTSGDGELRELESRRDSLVAELRGDLSPEERTRLEIETAQVLRAIDERKARPAPAPSNDAHAAAVRNATIVGFLWGAGSVLILGGLAWFVMNSAEPRPPETGPTAQQQAPPDPAVMQLEEVVRRSPDNLDARMTLAQAYLERDNLMGVFEQTQYVLSKSPRHSRALTYQALVRMAMGQQNEAMQMLQAATQADPMLLDAWVALAWVHTQSGDIAQAETAMQEAMKRRPDEKERLQQVLAQMKAHQGVNMAGGAQQTPQDGKSIRVTLKLERPVQNPRAVVFIIARAEGVSAGPPIAAKRVDASALPGTVELTSADSMMGQPLPDRVRLEARLDSDGDAATRNPADPSAARDSVAAGSAITLTLK